MALAKFGQGIEKIIGSIGGNIFHRGPFGYQVRKWQPRVRSRTPAQKRVSNAFTSAMNAWKEHAWTAAETGLWNNWIARHPYKSKISETISLTHYQAFIRYNWYRFYNGLTAVFVPPND